MNSIWQQHFNRIYCIHYLPAQEKFPRLKEELKRVGIWDSPNFEMRYTCPSKYDECIFKEYQHKELAPNLGYVNLCLEVRKILYEAKEFGYERILLLEDDVAFLKDQNELTRILDATPKDYDIVQYDKFVNNNSWMRREWQERCIEKRINDDFIDASGTLFTSAACMALSKKGIEQMLYLMDETIMATDVAPFFMRDCKYAVAIKNLAIQVFYGKCNSTKTCKVSSLHMSYTNCGVDYDLYELPDGYGVGKFYDP